MLRHWQQVAAGVLNLHEVEHDEIGAGVDEHLGGEGEVFGLAVAPGAAVDVDIHRRVGLMSFVDIELFMLAGAVGDALRRKSFQHRLAGGGAALGEQRLIGRVDRLIVSVVELLLIHVEPDERAFDAGCRYG